MELTSIPGVGAKTADALEQLDDPERALSEGDVATIARAPGISEGRAARIARAAIRDRHDDDGGFAATPRAREIYRDTLSLLQERTVTDYAARRLGERPHLLDPGFGGAWVQGFEPTRSVVGDGPFL